jgi:hypothetical protein
MHVKRVDCDDIAFRLIEVKAPARSRIVIATSIDAVEWDGAMAGISIACTSNDAARVDRYKSGGNDSVYVGNGESAALTRFYLAKVSVAEAGTPALELVNDTEDQRVDIYSVRGTRTAPLRPLMPERSRAVTLAANETLLLIPIVIATPSASTRRKRR